MLLIIAIITCHSDKKSGKASRGHVTSSRQVALTDQGESSRESDMPMCSQSNGSEESSSDQATSNKTVTLDTSVYMEGVMSNLKV